MPPLNTEEIRGNILGLIIGLILIVAGYMVSNVLFSVGDYTVTVVNQAMNRTAQVLIPASQVQIVGIVILISGIVLIIVAISLMIHAVLRGVQQ